MVKEVSQAAGGMGVFVSRGVQVRAEASRLAPIHSLPSPDFGRTLIPSP